MNKKLVAFVAVVTLSTVVMGCGGGSTTVKAGNNTTVGQELQDLQKARDSGAITEKEYNSAKKKILSKH